MLAHISGFPVEETVLSVAPIALVAGSLALVFLRERVRGGSYKQRASAGAGR